MCEYSSFETGNLKSHMMHKHKEEKPYKCDQCNYTCVSYGQLQQHMKTFQVQPMQQKLHWKEQAHKTFQNSHDLALFVHNNFEIQNNQFCVVWLNWKLSRHLIVVNVWYFDIKDNNHYNDEYVEYGEDEDGDQHSDDDSVLSTPSTKATVWMTTMWIITLGERTFAN